jgi:hypothetical protein
MRRYPQLGPAKVLDALAFAYDNPDVIQADLDREQQLFEERGGPTQFARPLSQLALPFAAPPAARPEPEPKVTPPLPPQVDRPTGGAAPKTTKRPKASRKG